LHRNALDRRRLKGVLKCEYPPDVGLLYPGGGFAAVVYYVRQLELSAQLDRMAVLTLASLRRL